MSKKEWVNLAMSNGVDVGDRYRKRIERAIKVTSLVLNSEFAQTEGASEAGVPKITLKFEKKRGEPDWTQASVARTDPPARRAALVEVMAMARIFVLQTDGLHWQGLCKALDHFCDDDRLRVGLGDLRKMWEDQPFKRYRTEIFDKSGESNFPSEGVWDGKIGDRVLYSQLVHANEASDILDEIDDTVQMQAATTLAGDWTAIIAFQEMLISRICPDLCEQLTEWDGHPFTIFERLGVET